MLALYKMSGWLLYGVSRPFLEAWSRLEGSEGVWAARLGYVPKHIIDTGPYDIWMQAVSTGEVGVAEAIVKAIDKRTNGIKILVSATTPAGIARAMSSLAPRCSVIPYPLDFPQVAQRIASAIRPRLYACLETELWPNLIKAVQDAGSKTILINGRISAKSLPRYRKIGAVIHRLLKDFSGICAISEVNKDRLAAIGAPKEKIYVTGNAKFEDILSRPDQKRVDAIRARLDINTSQKVIVAGSLRGDEERPVIDAYLTLKHSLQDLILFLVPRHINKVSCISLYLNNKNIKFQLWSKLETGERRICDVVLVDMMGPLFDLYGLASAAFVGGSLVSKGGQNIMEPAAWACPVFYGPHTDNFEEARSALEIHGGGCEVRCANDIADAMKPVLNNHEMQHKQGRAARRALKELSHGAADKQAGILLELLNQPSSTARQLFYQNQALEPTQTQKRHQHP